MTRRKALAGIVSIVGLTALETSGVGRIKVSAQEAGHQNPEGISVEKLSQLNGHFSPKQVFAVKYQDPSIPEVYRAVGGQIGFLDEEQLVSQLGQVVMRQDNQIFTDNSGQKRTALRVIKPLKLDTAVTGTVDHWGADLATSDKTKTILTSLFQGKNAGWVNFERIGPHALVMQLVDRNGQDIKFDFGGKPYLAFVLHGHIREPNPELMQPAAIGKIITVGQTLGDLTNIPLPEMQAHVHMEMLLIQEAQYELMLKQGKTLLDWELVREEESENVYRNHAYLDWSFLMSFWKGDPWTNTGRSKGYWDLTESLATRRKVQKRD